MASYRQPSLPIDDLTTMPKFSPLSKHTRLWFISNLQTRQLPIAIHQIQYFKNGKKGLPRSNELRASIYKAAKS